MVLRSSVTTITNYRGHYRYVKARGDPATLIAMLVDNYQGYALTCNLLQDWLVIAGLESTEVRELMQSHIKDIIRQVFDSEKATSIFEGETGVPTWLNDLIAHREWRQLIYELSEENKSSLMLNYIIKLISDAGYQSEIASVSTVANQLDVFSAVLASAIGTCLNAQQSGAQLDQQPLREVTSMGSISQFTYLYCQALLHAAIKEQSGTSSGATGPGRTERTGSSTGLIRLSQEMVDLCSSRGPLVTQWALRLGRVSQYPGTLAAMSTMLSATTATIPVDTIQTIYNQYTLDEPPPVELLQHHEFFDIIIRELFSPNPDQSDESRAAMCAHVLAYATSVTETCDGELHTELFASTLDAITKAAYICNSNLLTEKAVRILEELVSLPVVAIGLLSWIRRVVLDSDFFSEFSARKIPPHFKLLDEIVSKHGHLAAHVLSLLSSIYEYP